MERQEDVLHTVKEVATILKVTPGYVYKLIKLNLLPALKLGSMKVRRQAMLEFLEKYEGYDLTNLEDIRELDFENDVA